MKLLIDRIITEFNKIYYGNKRVGDSAKLAGKYERNLSVLDSTKLGGKTESSLNVNHSVFSDKVEKLRSIGTNGDPDVNANGDPIFKTENNLSVYNTQMVRGSEPIDLEVDISRRLKAGDLPTSPTFTVSSLMDDVNLRRVKDSSLLGGKTESALDVSTSQNSANSALLENTAQSDLVVLEANQSLKLKRPNGDLVGETELIVYASNKIKYGTTDYNLIELKDYILDSETAKEVKVYDAFSAGTLKTANGDKKSWDELKTELKTTSTSEIYKATRIVVSASTAYTGTEYRTWLIDSTEFSNKVAGLNSKTTDRAVRFGDSSDNKTITEFRAEIKTTKINNAKESDTLNGQTAENIITSTRNRILTNASSNLTQAEADGFFGNNDVKINVKAIKVSNSANADTFSNYTLTEVKNQVKSDGGVYSSKYIFADPNGSGLKSYIDITNDISSSASSIIGNATVNFNTLGKIEEVIDNNLTIVNNNLTTEQVNRIASDNNLGNRIDTITTRLDSGQLNFDSQVISGTDSAGNPSVIFNMTNNDSGVSNYKMITMTGPRTFDNGITYKESNTQIHGYFGVDKAIFGNSQIYTESYLQTKGAMIKFYDSSKDDWRDFTYSTTEVKLGQTTYPPGLFIENSYGTVEAIITSGNINGAMDSLEIDDNNISTSTVYSSNKISSLLIEKVDNSQVQTNVPSNAVFTDTVYIKPASEPISYIVDLQSNLDNKVNNSRVLTDVPSGAVFTDTDTVYIKPTSEPISYITNLQSNLDNKVNNSRVLTDVPSGAVFTDTVYNKPTNEPISYITNLQVSLDNKLDASKVLTDVPSGAVFTDTVTEIDDSSISQSKVWTSYKVNTELSTKADSTDLLTPVPSGAVFTDTVTEIDDTSTSLTRTYSSQKIQDEIDDYNKIDSYFGDFYKTQSDLFGKYSDIDLILTTDYMNDTNLTQTEKNKLETLDLQLGLLTDSLDFNIDYIDKKLGNLV